jgi:hypothetical protein
MRNRKTLAGSALCLGVIAGILAGGVLVHAQGGGAGEISACVLPTTPGTLANVRIIGAGERCPSGTPVRWNAQGPAGPPGTAEVSPRDVAMALKPPPGGSAATTAADVARNVKFSAKTGKPTFTKSKSFATKGGYNGGEVRCPAGFPVAVTGGFSVTGINFPPGTVLANFPIVGNWWGKPDWWHVRLARGPFGPGEPPAKTWTVKVSVKCAKK